MSVSMQVSTNLSSDCHHLLVMSSVNEYNFSIKKIPPPPFLKEIEFVDGSLLKLKSYIEVYLEQPMEFKLLLVEMDSDEIVWKAKLRECECFIS